MLALSACGGDAKKAETAKEEAPAKSAAKETKEAEPEA